LNVLKNTEKAKGQALVELAVILPVLILFMAAVIPLIARGSALPWLDERLSLRQLGQDNDQVHPLLQHIHNLDLLPPYIDKTKLQESTRSASMGMSIPPLGHIYPGDTIRKLTTATLSEYGWWNREILGRQQEQDCHISRGLAMLTALELAESRVPAEVKRLALIGIVSGKVGFLKKIGFNLFHLDLDALPEPDKRGE